MLMSDPCASLQCEQHTMQTLHHLLLQEQAALIEASIEGLTDLTQAKASLVSELGRLAKQRHAALAAAGFAASESGMRDWIDATTDADQHTSSWTTLLSMTTEARELNRVNGMLIGRHLLRNQTELNILQGKPQNSNFYGRNGQSTGKGIGRGLAIG